MILQRQMGEYFRAWFLIRKHQKVEICGLADRGEGLDVFSQALVKGECNYSTPTAGWGL
jgi:hypothetical protein